MDAFNEVMNAMMTYSAFRCAYVYICTTREEEEKAMVLEVFELCHQ